VTLPITAHGLPGRRLGPDDGSPPDEGQVDACARFLVEYATPIRAISSPTSYSLKHDVEFWTLGLARAGLLWCAPLERGGLYVANGAFIEAAVRAGYRVEPANSGSPNARFNMYVSARMKRETRRRLGS
jgi:hypothetical protein